MTESPSLFPAMRSCCVCGCTARAWRKHPDPDEPRILSVGSSVYRKGNGKSTVKAAVGIQICEQCFVKAITGFGAIVRMAAGRDLKFWNALAGSLSNRYSSMLLEDMKV
jgi:hypothetical protein